MEREREQALFVEPNAYIMNVKANMHKPKKIIFQEPYENMPNHYINNNFQRGKCDCVPKERSKNPSSCENKQNFPSFDLSTISSLISNMGNLFSGGIGNLISMLTKSGGANNSSNNSENNFDLKNLLSLFTGAQGGANIFNLFKTKKKEKPSQNSIYHNTTDIPIKEYTRVD